MRLRAPSSQSLGLRVAWMLAAYEPQLRILTARQGVAQSASGLSQSPQATEYFRESVSSVTPLGPAEMKFSDARHTPQRLESRACAFHPKANNDNLLSPECLVACLRD